MSYDRNHDHDLVDVIQLFLRGALAQVNVMLPGKVLSFDGTSNPPRATVRIAVRKKRLDVDGNVENYEGPILPDLPVCYPMGSGGSIYWPLGPGDEVMVEVCDRDIDNAIETGQDINDAATMRRHNQMDGVVKPLAWSTSVPTTARGTGLVLESSEIKLGEGAVAGVARQGDDVTPNAFWKAWFDSVGNAAGVGPSPSGSMGDISTASTKVKAE